MLKDYVRKLPLLKVGTTVTLNVPTVDRGPLDFPNIVGVIINYKNDV